MLAGALFFALFGSGVMRDGESDESAPSEKSSVTETPEPPTISRAPGEEGIHWNRLHLSEIAKVSHGRNVIGSHKPLLATNDHTARAVSRLKARFRLARVCGTFLNFV